MDPMKLRRARGRAAARRGTTLGEAGGKPGKPIDPGLPSRAAVKEPDSTDPIRASYFKGKRVAPEASTHAEPSGRGVPASNQSKARALSLLTAMMGAKRGRKGGRGKGRRAGQGTATITHGSPTSTNFATGGKVRTGLISASPITGVGELIQRSRRSIERAPKPTIPMGGTRRDATWYEPRQPKPKGYSTQGIATITHNSPMKVNRAGSYKGKSLALGGGGRFARMSDALVAKGMSRERADAITAGHGRQKYGGKRFAQMGTAGRLRAARARAGR